MDGPALCVVSAVPVAACCLLWCACIITRCNSFWSGADVTALMNAAASPTMNRAKNPSQITRKALADY